MKQRLKAALLNKGLDVEVSDAILGPRTETFALRPRGKTRVRDIRTRLEDLQVELGVAAAALRITTDGALQLELARVNPPPLPLVSILRRKGAGIGTVTLGLDSAMKPVDVALDDLPHLLIAGSTGSGKSVALHAIVSGLLYTHGAEHLRLVLIDPKRLELVRYEGLPHLACGVTYEATAALEILQELIDLMDRRYAQLAACGASKASERPDLFPGRFVVVIDEYADLLGEAGKELENRVVRLAQKARAAGIHLVLATQRPSVDVVTGRLKANFPSRLALRTSSATDSRVVLDRNGAEALLGKGDALFLGGDGGVRRLQVPLTTAADAANLKRYYCGTTP